jgi:drug/metabolite transporter (DMT)-like permease
VEVNRRVSGWFFVLCVLSGSGWILNELWTSPAPALTRIAAHNAFFALFFWLISRSPRKGATVPIPWFKTGAWGAILLALPQVLFAIAGGKVSGFTQALVFTLVPVVVVFLLGQRATFGAEDNPHTLLGPALAGIGGAALLLPFALPNSTLGILFLLAMLIAAVFAGIAAVRLNSLLSQTGIWRGAAIVCASAAVLSLSGAIVDWVRIKPIGPKDLAIELASCLFIDGPLLWLTVWLLHEMNPISFSSRYLLIPLVTIAEGFILVRPRGNWLMAAGVLLLAGGGLALLRSETSQKLSAQVKSEPALRL